MIKAAMELNVSEHLFKGALTIDELAKLTESHAPSLQRLMRGLASIGIFKCNEERKWEMTPLSTILHKYFKHFSSYLLDYHVAWTSLTEVVKTGENQFEKLYGTGYWNWSNTNPKILNNVVQAYRESNEIFCSKLTDIYDFDQFEQIVDIGGNSGWLISRILKSTKKVTGIVFDQIEVIKEAEKQKIDTKVLKRMRFVAGDALVSVPSGGDCYTMKWVLGDFDDAAALKILSNITNVMKKNAKLILILPVIKDDNKQNFGNFLDLEQMFLGAGHERTETELRELLKKAGFRIERIIESGFDLCDIVEAVHE
ncbi:methyltransferase-like protein, partial [Leptotrombidium deliense]